MVVVHSLSTTRYGCATQNWVRKSLPSSGIMPTVLEACVVKQGQTKFAHFAFRNLTWPGKTVTTHRETYRRFSRHDLSGSMSGALSGSLSSTDASQGTPVKATKLSENQVVSIDLLLSLLSLTRAQVVQAAMSRFLQTASDKDKEVFGRLFKEVGETVPAQLETKVTPTSSSSPI